MTNFDRVSNWLKDAGQQPEHFNAQLAADLEEIKEYFEALQTMMCEYDLSTFLHFGTAIAATKALNQLVKERDGKCLLDLFNSQPQEHKKSLLDAICDREVTANGLCYMLGFDKNLADQLVQDSNDSKLLVDDNSNRYAERNGHGKIVKPSSFIPVDLSDCIGE